MCRKNSRNNETTAYTTDKTIQFSGRPKINNSAINVWLLSRIKSYIALDYKNIYYKAYIQPHLDNYNVIWGKSKKAH